VISPFFGHASNQSERQEIRRNSAHNHLAQVAAAR